VSLVEKTEHEEHHHHHPLHEEHHHHHEEEHKEVHVESHPTEAYKEIVHERPPLEEHVVSPPTETSKETVHEHHHEGHVESPPTEAHKEPVHAPEHHEGHVESPPTEVYKEPVHAPEHHEEVHAVPPPKEDEKVIPPVQLNEYEESAEISAAASSSSSSPPPPPSQKPYLNITIIVSGSRGDVQPYLCLAQELQHQGHKVVFGVEERLHPLVESFGIPYAHISGDPTSMFFTNNGQKLLNEGKILSVITAAKKAAESTYEQCLADYTKACENADVIVSGALCLTQAYCIAESKKIPWVPMVLGPTFETGEFPLWVNGTSWFFKFLNRATYSFTFWQLWKSERDPINKWRTQTLKLHPMKYGMVDVIKTTKAESIVACPEFLVPGEKKPQDYPENITFSGALFPPNGVFPLDPQLEEFVQAGDPPIYFGIGSMPAPDPKNLLVLVSKVVKVARVRAVIVTGWTEITEELKQEVCGDTKEVIIVNSAPHDWLFPRCAVLIHHCGIGTVIASLRAGVPSIAVPVYLDQPFWARRLYELGVSAKPIPFNKLTVEALLGALKEVSKSEIMRPRAQSLAQSLTDNEGAQKAAEVVLKAARLTPKFAYFN